MVISFWEFNRGYLLETGRLFISDTNILECNNSCRTIEYGNLNMVLELTRLARISAVAFSIYPGTGLT